MSFRTHPSPGSGGGYIIVFKMIMFRGYGRNPLNPSRQLDLPHFLQKGEIHLSGRPLFLKGVAIEGPDLILADLFRQEAVEETVTEHITQGMGHSEEELLELFEC